MSNKESWIDLHNSEEDRSLNIVENIYPSKCMQSFYKFHIQPLLNKKDNFKFLEIGCGSGANFKIFSENEVELFGLDISEKALNRVKDLNKNIKTYLGNSYSLPFRDNTFDFVLADACLYYCENIAQFKKSIFEIYRVLKKNGVIRIYTKANDDAIVSNKNFVEKYKYVSDSKWENKMELICLEKEDLVDLLSKFECLSIGKEKFNHVNSDDSKQHSYWVVTATK